VTQCERILQYIADFGSISTIQAFSDLGITRLASRIHDLRRMGIDIESETRTAKNRYGEMTHFSVYRKV
jgi:hypothetical protein